MDIYDIVDKLVKSHPIMGPLLLVLIAIGIFASSIQSYMLLMRIKRKKKKAP